MNPRLDELVRRVMRNLSPDYVEDEFEEPLTGAITKDEAEEVRTEIARRVYTGFDNLEARISARVPHLTDDQRVALNQELESAVAAALAGLGKRPDLN